LRISGTIFVALVVFGRTIKATHAHLGLEVVDGMPFVSLEKVPPVVTANGIGTIPVAIPFRKVDR